MRIYLEKNDGIIVGGRYWVAKENVSFDAFDLRDFCRVINSFYETTKEEWERYYSFHEGFGGHIRAILSLFKLIEKPPFPKPLKPEDQQNNLKTGGKKRKITEEEYNQIIQELAQRVKDTVVFNAERKIRKEMPKDFVERVLMEEDSSLEINYCYKIMIDDIHQIFSRIKQNEKIKGRRFPPVKGKK